MAKTQARSEVRVEGIDDLHSLRHLLMRHGFEYRKVPLPDDLPEFAEPAGSVERLLNAMEAVIPASTGRRVGFVLDADSPIQDRWRAVQDRLNRVDVTTPHRPPPEGFVGDSEKYKARGGVWLMPDNQQDGKLEDFLRMLVVENDPLIGYARYATNHAVKKGAAFSENDPDKAVIHTWLAWQKEPGKPYGIAIQARFFRHDSAAALAFVAWFKRLFDVAQHER